MPAAPFEYLESLAARINADPDRFNLPRAAFQFVLSGAEAATASQVYHLVVVDGTAQAGEGSLEQADLTVEMSRPDFDDLVSGKLGPIAAFMSGRLRLRGDMSLAMRLQSVLSS